MENQGRLRAWIGGWLSPRGKNEFQLVRRGGLVWHVRRSFSGPALDELLDDPNAVVDERGLVLREKGMSKTAAAAGFVIKRNPVRKRSQAVKAFFRKSPGLRALFQAFRLEAAGVRTAVPVAAAEKRRFRFLSSSYFVMQERQDTVTLGKWDGDRSQMANRLGRLIGRLHAMKYSHRDLKAPNILVDASGEPFLIDMEGVRFWWFLPRARVRGDLERLVRTARELREVEAVHRSLFLLAYCRERGIHPSQLRKHRRFAGNVAGVWRHGSTRRLRWIAPGPNARQGLWLVRGTKGIDARAKARARHRADDFERRNGWFEIGSTRGDGRPLIWKWIRPVSLPIDYWRRYLGRCQASREVSGLLLLRRIGIRVPNLHCSGFSVNPSSEYESFLVLDYCVGTVNGHRFLRDCRDPGARRRFLLAVVEDVITMIDRRVYLKDLHLGNVLVDPGRPEILYWIDSEVLRSRTDRMKRRWFERMTERVISKALRNGLREDEKGIICNAFDRQLHRSTK